MELKYKIYGIVDNTTYNGELFENNFEDNLSLREFLLKIKEMYNIKEMYSGVIKNIKEFLWEEYGIVDLIDENEYEIYYKMTIKQLDDEFRISSRPINIYFVGGLGAAVGEKDGISFFFHTNEKDIHHQPHIHCKYNEIEYRINLITLKPMDKLLFKNPKKNKMAEKCVMKNQKGLLKYWDDVIVRGIPSNFNMFLEF